MPKVWCPVFECPNRDKETGVCLAVEIFRDGNFCSGFEKSTDHICPVYGEKGYEGYIRTIKPIKEYKEIKNVLCPKCFAKARAFNPNCYVCPNEGCEVATFRMSSAGKHYEIKLRKTEKTYFETKADLDRHYKEKLPYHEYPEEKDEKK